MSKLSSKHQVTIPVSILREAGLAALQRIADRERGCVGPQRASDGAGGVGYRVAMGGWGDETASWR